MIGIIDYGAGNLGNVLRALSSLQYEASLLGSPSNLGDQVDLLVLPGVGAFPPAREELARRGWIPVLREWGNTGKPLLGICLGMQLLYEASLEDGLTEGFGFFPGTIAPLAGLKKTPHMGWNRVSWLRELPGITDLFQGGLDAYFVHGYAAPVNEASLADTAIDGIRFSSVSLQGKIAGFQFHPERSGREGLQLFGTFIRFLSGKSS
ncbi:MAG TPA: imidazole glycerol phosphate synthase subunit HisH [Synergistales bacterium]|nr:imidazole glycerol phosphate synthase subunit HisH [Synergistales bacterium]